MHGYVNPDVDKYLISCMCCCQLSRRWLGTVQVCCCESIDVELAVLKRKGKTYESDRRV